MALALTFSLLLGGCGNAADTAAGAGAAADTAAGTNTGAVGTGSGADAAAGFESGGVNAAASEKTAYFSDRDFEVEYDESKSAHILLNGDSADCSSDAVEISGTRVTIKDEGTYILSGTLEDGMIIVDAEKSDKTQLVLNGVTIHSETSAAIYIRQSDKVFITTAPDTTNTLSNGGTFAEIDENEIDAVIFSKEDVTLNGSGMLVVTSPAGHGIVSKDSLKLTGGSYDINCASHGLDGKDDVCAANAELTIVSGKDGIHAENSDDSDYGYVYIQSGTFDITAQGDGLSAGATLCIENGDFQITSGGGSVNASAKASDSWGNFAGGGRHMGGRGGMMGGKGNKSGNGREAEGGKNGVLTDAGDGAGDSAQEDGTSMKGIKAAGDLIINGGAFVINSADDSVHSNASLTVNGGTFEIAAGDDAFHADDTLSVAEGSIYISESYEGMEGLHVVISGGDITLTAEDDGINAAGGMDESGNGGRDAGRGHGMMSGSSDGSILISGGTIQITAMGDGIDANGTLEITDGHTTVCGPVQGDTATLDYDVRGEISGGTFIGTGAFGMAQTFSDAAQGLISVRIGNGSEEGTVTLSDKNGDAVITYTPQLPYSVVILSSPEIISGETYTLTAGTVSREVTAG